jgi:hypothetical protein
VGTIAAGATTTRPQAVNNATRLRVPGPAANNPSVRDRLGDLRLLYE